MTGMQRQIKEWLGDHALPLIGLGFIAVLVALVMFAPGALSPVLFTIGIVTGVLGLSMVAIGGIIFADLQLFAILFAACCLLVSHKVDQYYSLVAG